MSKKKNRSLSSFTILLLIIVALAAITWFIPEVEQATLANVVMAPYYGFIDAIDVCIFILVLGGYLSVVTKTGALNAGVNALVRKLHGNELVLIPILMIIFAIGGTTFGFAEETLGFYALICTAMVAAGFDTLVATGAIILGAGVGCLGSTVNPFATGIASDVLVSLGINVNQGTVIMVGLTLLVVNLTIAILYVMRYARKVKEEKGSILSAKETLAMEHTYRQEEKKEEVHFNGKMKLILAIFGVTFLVMVIAVIPWSAFLGEEVYTQFFGWSSILNAAPLGEWWFGELAMWFFIMAIVVGIIGKLSEKEIVDAFLFGASDIVSVVLIIAVARGASVLMSQTGLDVYFLETAASLLRNVSVLIFAPLSYVIYIGLSFLIPSSSGCATVTMPIMGPLTQGLNFDPAVMILIFSAASGLVNLFTPTSGVVMGGLSIAKVEYGTWIKWVWKCVAMIGVASCVILTVAMMML
ncbi:MAG: YfcC family protein [Erysipelotrichales bacterium]|nr:YfcC family protein [Erysipelotrichales bacterium]